MDEYLGALLPPEAGPDFGCPANDPIAFVAEGGRVVMTCLSAPLQSFPPFARNVTLPADLPLTVTDNVFSFMWPTAAQAGTYSAFMADFVSGSSELLALATATVTFAP